MKISTKGRYGLAVMLCIGGATDGGERTDGGYTVAAAARELSVSKVYLEQVFAPLKRAGLIRAVKGSKGGYFLSAPAAKITALDILRATEPDLLEVTARSFSGDAARIDDCLSERVFAPLDGAAAAVLSSVTLQSLLDGARSLDYMFYI